LAAEELAMTTRDEGFQGHAANDPNRGDRVDTTFGVPVDRVRWGPILAGTFVALTALAVLSVLGAAIGLSAYDRGDDPRTFAAGAGIWGLISMILAFGLGGWVTARSVAIRGGENGLLNGFLVAAVGIPLMLFTLGGAATLMGHAATVRYGDRTSSAGIDTYGQATQAGATVRGTDDRATDALTTPTGDRREDARRASRNTAWGTLIGMVLAIGAASLAGYVGARDDGTRGTGGTGGYGYGRRSDRDTGTTT
jgi:hypothetical protein